MMNSQEHSLNIKFVTLALFALRGARDLLKN
jgi:hypothetical protein